MKKLKLIIAIILILAMAMVCFAACSKKKTEENDPGQISPTEDPTSDIEPTTIHLEETGVSFSHPDYDYFRCWINGVKSSKEYFEDEILMYSLSVGEYTIRVCALNDDDEEVAFNEYTYSTQEMTLSELTVDERTVSWTANGAIVSVKATGGSFQPTKESSYTAEEDGVEVTVRVSSGMDFDRNIYFIGKKLERSVRLIPDEKEVLDTPEWELMDGVIVWSEVENAVSFKVSYDGGVYIEAESASFSEEVGTHTIEIKAIGDEVYYTESLPAVVTYETRKTTLDITKIDANKVHIETNGAITYSANGGEEYNPYPLAVEDDREGEIGDEGRELVYLHPEEVDFTAEESGSIIFRAIATMEEGDNGIIYYCYSDLIEIDFVASSVRDYVMDEGDSTDDWSAEGYFSNRWKSSKASLTTSEKYDGTSALRLEFPTNGKFRFGKAISLEEGYNTLSFFYKGDDETEVTISLVDDTGKFVLSYDLGKMPSAWNHYLLSFEQEGWMVNGSETFESFWETHATATDADIPERVKAAFNKYEVLLSMTRLYITVTGDKTGNGAHYIDDILFGYSQEAVTSRYQPLYDLRSEYITLEPLNSGVNNELILTLKEQNVFSLRSTMLERNFEIEGSYEIDEEQGTLTLEEEEKEFTLSLVFARNGLEITALAVEDETSLAAHCSERLFLPLADFELDFNEEEEKEGVVDELWTQYTPAMSGWTALKQSMMSYVTLNTALMAKFSVGRNQTNRFVYNEGGATLGFANTIGLDVGNCDAGASAIGVKIIAIDSEGKSHYLNGSDTSFDSFERTDDLRPLSLSWPEGISVCSIEIWVENRSASTVNLYVDNISLAYQINSSGASEYAAPLISVGEFISFSHELTDVFEYSMDGGANWVKESYLAIPSDPRSYHLSVRAYVGEDPNPSDEAHFEFRVEEIELSDISVAVKGTTRTAFWTTNGKVSIRKDIIVGNSTTAGVFEAYEQDSFTVTKNMKLYVRAEAWFSDANGDNVFYIKEKQVERTVIIDSVVLDKVHITASQEGLSWAPVANANGYQVKVNNGDFVYYPENSYPFMTDQEGTYTVTVRSVIKDGNSFIAFSSDDVNPADENVFTYEMKFVELSDITKNGLEISWEHTAYRVTCKVGTDALGFEDEVYEYDEENDLYHYTLVPTNQGTYEAYVTAEGGYDAAHKIYYYTAAQGFRLQKTTSIAVSRVSKPILTPKTDKTGLKWTWENKATAYVYRVDLYHEDTGLWEEGAEQQAVKNAFYAFPTEEGLYRITVQGIGNGSNVLASLVSDSYTFRVCHLALSEITIEEQDDTHCLASYTCTAKEVNRLFDGSSEHDASISVTDTSVDTTTTVLLALEVYPDFDETNRVYYYSPEAKIHRETRLVVFTYLDEPNLTIEKVDGEDKLKMTWSTSDPNTTSCEYTLFMKDQNGVYAVVENEHGVKNTSGTYLLPTVDGEYKVCLEPKNNDTERFPARGIAVKEFTIHTVTLTTPKPSNENANLLVWDCVALRQFMSFEGYSENENDLWENNYYLNAEGQSDITLYLKAIGGFDADKLALYKGSRQTSYLVDYSKLLTPDLRVYHDKDTSDAWLEWDSINKADKYKYKELVGEYSEEDLESALSSEDGWSERAKDNRKISFSRTDLGEIHRIYVKAIGGAATTLTPSDLACWTYTPYQIALEENSIEYEITEEDVAFVTWEKVGIIEVVTVTKTLGGIPEYKTITPDDDYSCTITRTLTLNLTCSTGYDESENHYYFDSEARTDISASKDITVPTRLAKPTLTLKDAGVSVESSDNNTNQYQVTVKKDGVDHRAFTKTYTSNVILYHAIDLLSETEGTYTLTVVAQSTENQEQYPDSNAATISFTVRRVALTEADVTASGTEKKITFSQNIVGKLMLQKDSASPERVTESIYPLTQTVLTLKIWVDVGADAENAILYVGDKIELSDKKVVVPITLETPQYECKKSEIRLSKVTNATGCSVKLDNGGWEKIPYTADDYISLSYNRTISSHVIRFSAYATDSEQYPDSAEGQIDYETKALSVSFYKEGASFKWDAAAYSLEKKINGGSYSSDSLKGTRTVEETTSMQVRAGWGYRGGVYYHNTAVGGETEENIVSEELKITITRLATPVLRQTVSEIVWDAISGATEGYEVSLDGGEYKKTSQCKTSYATKAGKHIVKVRAAGDGGELKASLDATFAYTVETVTLSDITVNVDTATWTVKAYKSYLKISRAGNTISETETTQTTYKETAAGNTTVTVRAIGGWNGSMYYYASSPIEKSATIRIQKLDTPVLSTNNKGITWAAVSNAATYQVTVDGATTNKTDRNVSFSTSVGKHTVSVKAIGTSNYLDSNVAEFVYETKQTSLSLLKKGTEYVTWKSDSVKVQYSTDKGKTYSDAPYSGYTAKKSGDVTFRAVSGWDASAGIYYTGSASDLSATFSLPGMTIGENFESGSTGWTKEYYDGKTSSWISESNVTVTSVVDGRGAGSAIRLQSNINSNAYRFGYQFGDFPDSYKSMSFDIRLNAYHSADVQTFLRFQDSASGTYVDYNLKNLNLQACTWYHVTLFFEDSNLIINSGGKEYSAPKAKSLLGEASFYDKIKALDKMYVTVKGFVANGPVAYTCIDNIIFSKTGSSTSASKISVSEQTFDDGGVSTVYTNSKWKQYQYDAGKQDFVTASGALRVEDQEKILALYCGGTTYKATYNVEGSASIGTANHFQIDLAAEKNKTVRYRIELKTKSGSIIYVAGGDGFYASLTGSGINSMTTLSVNFTAAEIKSITIYATSGNEHLFMDNVILCNLT